MSSLFRIDYISLSCRPIDQQALGETSDAAARFLLLECVSRAVPLAAATDGNSGDSARRLASLLASLATFELRLRPDAFHAEGSGSPVAAAAAPTELLECLRVCAAHLPRPERPLSLFSDDHLTLASPQGEEAESASSLSLGDVLVSVLRATPSAGAGAQGDGGEEGRSGAWEVVGAVVFHGYGRRPLSALAAVAISGVSAPRGRNSGDADDGERLVSASRALCVAATFVKAEAVAMETGGGDDEEHLRSAERDLVAVFPAAMLAVTSDDKVVKPGGFPLKQGFCDCYTKVSPVAGIFAHVSSQTCFCSFSCKRGAKNYCLPVSYGILLLLSS